MRNINQHTPELINRILGIICLEKGLSENTKTAYAKDISLAFDWFKNKNINCLRANEKNFRDLFLFLQSKYYKPRDVKSRGKRKRAKRTKSDLCQLYKKITKTF